MHSVRSFLIPSPSWSRKYFRLLDVGSKRFLTNKVDRSVTGLIAQQQCVGPLHTPLRWTTRSDWRLHTWTHICKKREELLIYCCGVTNDSLPNQIDKHWLSDRRSEVQRDSHPTYHYHSSHYSFLLPSPPPFHVIISTSHIKSYPTLTYHPLH